ncbi:MAG: immunoglobulin domain-containing protein [Verrucomicrobia bacterium]|nr:immunoglobulin domain-containing protein [Verrucomicrobiota bacterium]
MKTQSWKTRTLLAGAVFVALAVSPSARADYESTLVSQAPVGYWRLNETLQPQNIPGAANAGSLGASGLGNYVNFPVRGLPGPFAGSTAVGLDGGSQSVTTPWVAGLNGNSFSVELWVNPAIVPAFRYVASSVVMASPRSGWYLAQDDGGVFGAGNAFVVRMFNQNATVQTVQLAAPLTGPAGTWYHLVLTYDGTTAALYMNGVQVTNAPAAYVPNVSAAFTVGCRSDNTFHFPGEAAEAAMYTTALSPAQVAAHYNAATTAPATYAATVLADAPVLYHRYQEPIDPPAANLGTRGAAANGLYIYNAQAGVNGPATPDFAGFDAANKAVGFNAGGGVVRIPALGLNTNTVTISCWLRAVGSQPIGTGLVLHGSGANASGLTIDQVNGGLGLGYIWNGNNYGISPTSDFGLPALPDSQWAFAALVIQPSEASIYICDVNNYANWSSMTNSFNVNHLNQPFAQATLVGAAAGFTNRNFNGDVDEVAIFNRSLSAGELYTQYAAAVGGVPPRIFADLQGPADAVAAGDPLVLSVDAGGTPALTYTWRRNSTTVATTTNGVLTIASASLSDGGIYEVIIANGFGTDVTSQQVAVTVVTPTQPTITAVRGFFDRTLYPTGTLSLAVSATGGGLKYQWYKNEVPIPAATGPSYTIPRITTADAGNYSVSITNSVGATSNGPVAITIPAPAAGSYEALIVNGGPQAWWRLNESPGSTNLFDGMGRHDGFYTNATGSGPLPTLGVAGAIAGSASTAASFSSTGQGIGMIPYSADLNAAVFSVEAWVKTSVLTGQAPLSSTFGNNGWWWQTTGGTWGGFGPSGYAPIYDNGNTAALVSPGQWTHLVIRYNGSRVIGGTAYPYSYYVNGQTDGFVWTGSSVNTSGPFIIGARGLSATVLAESFFDGEVDEVAVYGRELAGAEILARFEARFGTTTPPYFIGDFIPQTVVTGTSVRFSTIVQGSVPITLQWYKGSEPIVGQTTASLTIPSTAVSDTGTYTLWATNGAGVSSQSVNLTVINPVGYANVTNDLVLHLRFDGNPNDSSGRNNNGTPVGSPAFVQGLIGAEALQYTTDTSSAIYDYVTLGAPADLQFGGSSSFTVGLWVKLPQGATPPDLPFIGTATNSMNNPGWDLGPTYETGGWQWCLNDGVNNFNVNGPANSINNGEWHHFVLVVDRAAKKANTYLDGVCVGVTDITTLGNVDTGAPTIIGQDPTGTYPESGTATLDDLGIWRRALTALEVTQIYSAGSTAGRSFDTVSPEVNLTIGRSGNNIVISYDSGTLQQSSSVGADAVWTTVTGANPPSHTVTPTGAALYFRVLLP